MKRIFIFLLLRSFSFAHLDVGKDVAVDKYIVDFGYSPKTLNTQTSATIAFNLLDVNKNVIEPDYVWVRISNEDDVVRILEKEI